MYGDLRPGDAYYSKMPLIPYALMVIAVRHVDGDAYVTYIPLFGLDGTWVGAYTVSHSCSLDVGRGVEIWRGETCSDGVMSSLVI